MKISMQSVRQASTTALAGIGQVANTPDGSTWIYVKAAEAISKGHVVVPDTAVGVDTVSSSSDQQSRVVYITEASAGWTVGAYANAWGLVDSGTGVGQEFKVKDNTTDTLILYPEFALSTALAVADSDITLVFPYLVDKAAVTSDTQQATGIAQVAIASGSYGWVLQKGNGVAIAGEALTASAGFTTGDDTEGQVIKAVTAEGAYDEQNLGYCRVANESVDKAALVYVNVM